MLKALIQGVTLANSRCVMAFDDLDTYFSFLIPGSR